VTKTAWETKVLTEAYDYISPGGASEIRELPSFDQGEITHARALPARPSIAATTTGLYELFFILGGEGELWRRSGDLEDVTPLRPGRCVSVPPGISFQYRATNGPLDFIVSTAPRWRRENWAESALRHWDEGGSVRTATTLRPGPWATVDLPEVYDHLAPDGSEIRPLTTFDAGGLAHARLHPGHVSAPVRHRTVQELWYVLSGRGHLWRADGTADETVELAPSTAITIPTGTSFQFRCDEGEPLDLLLATFPRWPGATEAERVDGAWELGDRSAKVTIGR